MRVDAFGYSISGSGKSRMRKLLFKDPDQKPLIGQVRWTGNKFVFVSRDDWRKEYPLEFEFLPSMPNIKVCRQLIPLKWNKKLRTYVEATK